MAGRNVQGLKSQLERYSRAALTTLAAGAAIGARDRLLIDASSLEAALVARLGATVARFDNERFVADLFQLAASYVRGLRRTGLRVVVVSETSCCRSTRCTPQLCSRLLQRARVGLNVLFWTRCSASYVPVRTFQRI